MTAGQHASHVHETSDEAGNTAIHVFDDVARKLSISTLSHTPTANKGSFKVHSTTVY